MKRKPDLFITLLSQSTNKYMYYNKRKNKFKYYETRRDVFKNEKKIMPFQAFTSIFPVFKIHILKTSLNIRILKSMYCKSNPIGSR